MISFLALASAISFSTKVMTQGQTLSQRQMDRASVTSGVGVDLQEQTWSANAPVLGVPGSARRRLEEEIELESDDDDEEQGAAFDALYSDVLQPLHNHHEFQDLLSDLHSSNWADGCSKVFLDIGANQGTSIQMLFEPEKYGNGSVLPLLERYFGPPSVRSQPSNQSGLCAFGFEANPRFAGEHRNIEAAYAARGWKVQFFSPVVISDHDGAEDFYIEDFIETNSLNLTVHNLSDASNIGKHRKLELPAARLAELVRTKITERALSEDEVPGKVLMRIHLAGQVFVALPDLLQAGLLCQQTGVDGMLIEGRKQNSSDEQQNFTSWSEIKEAVKMQNGCQEPTELIETELDSVYVDAPVPLLPKNASVASKKMANDGYVMV